MKGTWFRLIRKEVLNKLVRVRVDIPNSLDALWRIDVKKAEADPPETVLRELRKLVNRIAGVGQRVYIKRAARMQSGPLVSVWKRQVVDGRVRYVLNDEHPLLAELLGDKDHARAARARACLRLVSNAFPADLYFSDAASDIVDFAAPHPTALIVTARNKMRASKEIPVSIELEGRLAETSVLLAPDDILKENTAVLTALITAASALKAPEASTLGPFWRDLPTSLMKTMVKNFQNHHGCILTSPEPLLEYIEWLETNVGESFDLLLRSTGPGEHSIAGQNITPMERTVVSFTASQIEFAKRRIASRGDERAGFSKEVIQEIRQNYALTHPGKDIPDKEYRKIRKAPLLMGAKSSSKTQIGLPKIKTAAASVSRPPKEQEPFFINNM